MNDPASGIQSSEPSSTETPKHSPLSSTPHAPLYQKERPKLFADPHILRHVGRPLLVQFFDAFAHLLPSKYFLPNPRPDNDHYFDALAELLQRTSELPAGLAQALHEVESVASPEYNTRVEADLGDGTEYPEADMLSRAIRAWLQSRPTEPPATEGPIIEAPPPAALAAKTPLTAASVTETPASEAPKHKSTESPPTTPFLAPEPDPWPEPVNLKALLDRLVELLRRLVILPAWAAETLALWIVHTYAFHLRNVTTYIGIESPEMRCGKTTLLSVLNELAYRALASSNISPPAFFRVIEDLSPTLLIDEVDTFLSGNEQLKGILNAGYSKKTAFVLRAAASTPSNGEADADSSSPVGAVKRFSCWCPKVLAKIGRFPSTLADRCIIIRMHRKTSKEQCDRSRELDALPLKRQCLRFVADHASEVASAKPQLPPELNDRAADIWEPLLVLADLAGGDWPELARRAALSLSASAQEASPVASLLIDIFVLFTEGDADRLFTRSLVAGLTAFGSRPWNEATKIKAITDTWLAQRLRPYGIKPRTLRIGDEVLKGYLREDFIEVFERYVPKSTLQAFLDEHTPTPPEPIDGR